MSSMCGMDLNAELDLNTDLEYVGFCPANVRIDYIRAQGKLIRGSNPIHLPEGDLDLFGSEAQSESGECADPAPGLFPHNEYEGVYSIPISLIAPPTN